MLFQLVAIAILGSVLLGVLLLVRAGDQDEWRKPVDVSKIDDPRLAPVIERYRECRDRVEVLIRRGEWRTNAHIKEQLNHKLWACDSIILNAIDES